MKPAVCRDCLARTWLLERLAAHLDVVRGRVGELLALADADLVDAVAGSDAVVIRDALAAFEPGPAIGRLTAAGLDAICRCDARYPPLLRSLGAAAPAVLHVAGGLERFVTLTTAPAVAIVGARRASPYALEVAGSLGRGAGRAGVPVVSGMALGVDAAAHEGALEAGGGTIAVLASAPERPYPAANRRLYRRIVAGGAIVSELGPSIPPRRWMFPARNRIVAALGSATVVVAARRGSGALLTAAVARGLRRPLGAVPGQVTAPLAWGPHELLRQGARLVADPADLLAMIGVDGRLRAPARVAVDPELEPLLHALADGHDPPAAFVHAGLAPAAGLAALAALELIGRIRRGPGGRFTIAA